MWEEIFNPDNNPHNKNQNQKRSPKLSYNLGNLYKMTLLSHCSSFFSPENYKKVEREREGEVTNHKQRTIWLRERGKLQWRFWNLRTAEKFWGKREREREESEKEHFSQSNQEKRNNRRYRNLNGHSMASNQQNPGKIQAFTL